jgi:threonyl-tRNA synthetase
MEPHDHRRIGQRQRLFHLQEEAPGMAVWHPRGLVVRRALEDAVRRRAEADGFLEVRTPQLIGQRIWEASGHWQHFREGIFRVAEDDDEPHGEVHALKPVNCPAHLQIAARMAPSHRDLPLRISELGIVHRDERRGSLLGLFRLRQFTQDDGHVLCDEAAAEEEIARFCRSLRAFYASFGFGSPEVFLATRPALRVGDDAVWDRAERILAQAAEGVGISIALAPGSGAFYGPKLEFVLRDRLDRAWQCGTIQLDHEMPRRFGVRYVDARGRLREPVMLHRALLGSIERFLAILLEHHAGALPAWLAPVQVVVVAVSERSDAFAREAEVALAAHGLRVQRSPARVARAIAEAHVDGVPYVVVVGDRERASRSLSVRDGSGDPPALLPFDVGVERLVERCRPPD